MLCPTAGSPLDGMARAAELAERYTTAHSDMARDAMPQAAPNTIRFDVPQAQVELVRGRRSRLWSCRRRLSARQGLSMPGGTLYAVPAWILWVLGSPGVRHGVASCASGAVPRDLLSSATCASCSLTSLGPTRHGLELDYRRHRGGSSAQERGCFSCPQDGWQRRRGRHEAARIAESAVLAMNHEHRPTLIIWIGEDIEQSSIR